MNEREIRPKSSMNRRAKESQTSGINGTNRACVGLTGKFTFKEKSSFIPFFTGSVYIQRLPCKDLVSAL